MRAVFNFILFTFFLVSSTLVSAETTFIDLDSAPGNYSVWRVSGLKASSVSFEATLVAVKKHKQWAPTYSFKFGDGNGKTINFKGALLGGTLQTASAILSVNGSESSLENKLLILPLEKKVAVLVSWSNGIVKVTVDGASEEFNVGFTPTEMQVSSSTSELQVKDIIFTN